MKPHVLMAGTGKSPYFTALQRSARVESVSFVDSQRDLLAFMDDNAPVDLLVTDLLIDTTIIGLRDKFSLVASDGLSGIECFQQHWPTIPIIVLSQFWHDTNVLAAYQAGVRWFCKKQYIADAQFVLNVVQVANGQLVVPDDFGPLLTNRIRCLLDPALSGASLSNQNFLFTLLHGLTNEQILAERGWQSMQVLYNQMSLLMASTGLASRQALLERSRKVGIDLSHDGIHDITIHLP